MVCSVWTLAPALTGVEHASNRRDPGPAPGLICMGSKPGVELALYCCWVLASTALVLLGLCLGSALLWLYTSFILACSLLVTSLILALA
jgi:hypothetical protein